MAGVGPRVRVRGRSRKRRRSNIRGRTSEKARFTRYDREQWRFYDVEGISSRELKWIPASNVDLHVFSGL